MPAVWKVHPANPPRAEALANALHIHPLTAQLLLNRGVDDAARGTRFLNPTLGSLDDPAGIPQLQQAVDRLRRAVAASERLVIFGDSDVDGLTASVILAEALQRLGATVTAYQSNRLRDGYGLPNALMQRLCRSQTRLLVLVDCGTNQPEAVRQLAAHGIDTIILDHHVPLKDMARPRALVNPYCHAGAGPASVGAGRGLCSAGLAFKVVQALLGDSSPDAVASFLDLAALGTLADCAPLVGDNRVMVVEGLRRLVRTPRPGLRRLCEATRVSDPEPEQVLKRLTPRLNASGRLGEAATVWHLLRRDLSGALEELLDASAAAHGTTKRLHRQIVAEAHEQVNRLHFRDHGVILVSGRGWHQGLMGPLASQLAERYGRPAIALAMDERQGIGSARSVPDVDLLEVLTACQSLLVRFGGHAQACGLTLRRKELEPFRTLVNQHARRLAGSRGSTRARMVDLELPLAAVGPSWVQETRRFAPFGIGNPRPTIVVRRLTIDVTSPRGGSLSDGATSVRGKGAFAELVAGSRYDVVATPMCDDDGVVMQVHDVKVSSERASPDSI